MDFVQVFMFTTLQNSRYDRLSIRYKTCVCGQGSHNLADTQQTHIDVHTFLEGAALIASFSHTFASCEVHQI